MFADNKVVAVVPARSGSKGIQNKNMSLLSGTSLIGLAGFCLDKLPWLDAKIISTDSPEYAAEGSRFGLEAPFLRPPELSGDRAGAVDTMIHALQSAETYYRQEFNIILIIEPTSPFRTPGDVEAAIDLLVSADVDSVVTVSPLDTKYHPAKVLKIDSGKITYYESQGANIIYRQALEPLYWRNGICYALTRRCLMEKRSIFTDSTLPLVIDRPLANIDEPLDLVWSEFLFNRNI